VGGTGKTALVSYIAESLKKDGHKVAIISRGYKRKVARSQGRKVASVETMGDEPFMLKERLKDIPVIVDANRFRAGERAVREYKADTVILDDGLQQWRLKKDLEIVTVSATCPFGNRRLLPCGILRQPLFSLKCADIFLLTKTNLSRDVAKIKDTLFKINPDALILESFHRPIGFYNIKDPSRALPADGLKGRTATIFSGIGEPLSFKETVKNLGITVGLSFEFPDHHNYTQKEMDGIISSSAEKKIATVITTEKDSTRLGHSGISYGECEILVMRIEITINEEEKFHSRLRGVYAV
jgi:tetraacyldisaccharide 4'-kinase